MFALRVALVTRRAGVDVTLPSLVVGVRVGLVVLVAIDTTKCQVVRRCRVAIVTGRPLASVGARVDRERVGRQPGACPGGRGVTRGAGSGQARGDVIRIRYRPVHRLVARVAVCRCSGIAPADVAEGARHGGVLARQRELGRIVVEHRALPLRGGMAQRAVLGETGRDVVRIRSGGVTRQVAAVARVRRTFEHIVDMAQSARHGGVETG